MTYRRPANWVEVMDFQAPQLQMSGGKEPSPRFWGFKRPYIETEANLPFTFLLLGRASSGGDLFLATRLGGIFLSSMLVSYSGSHFCLLTLEIS